MSKIIQTGAEGAETFEKKDTTIIEDITGGLTAPFGLFMKKKDEEYVSPRTAAWGAVIWAGLGFVAGDMLGDKVPYLGKRR